jgi:hypothetical protein
LVAGLVVVLALGAGVVAGAVAAGGGAEPAGGVVVCCASALVNAKPLTAATAMILMSMYASYGRFAKNVGGRRRSGVLPRERRNRTSVPGSTTHWRRDFK